MKKNQITYAKRARAILAKYKRRLGEKLDGNDPMAQAAMQKELDALMEQQENQKASMVQNQYQEMAYGGPLVGQGDVPRNLTAIELANAALSPNYVGATKAVLPGSNMVRPAVNRAYIPTPTGTGVRTGNRPRVASTPPREMYTPQYAVPQPTFDDGVPTDIPPTDIPQMFTPPGEEPKLKMPPPYIFKKQTSTSGTRMKSGFKSIIPTKFWHLGKDEGCFAYGGDLPQMYAGGGVPPYSSEYLDTFKKIRPWSSWDRTYTDPADNFNPTVVDNLDIATTLNPYTDLGARQTRDSEGFNVPQGTYSPGTKITPQGVQFGSSYGIPNYAQFGNKEFNSNANPYYNSTPNTKTTSTNKNNTQQSWFSQIPNESKIGAGVQGLTALTQMGIALANKPKNITYNPTYVAPPEEIRADEQLAAATRSYRGAQNNLRYLSPSQYMASMNDLSTREAATKAGIIEGVENTNVGARNENRRYKSEVAQRDEQMRNRMQMYNTEQGNQYVQNISTGIGNLGNVAAGFAKDEGSRKMQGAMMQFMNQSNYGNKTDKYGYPVATNKVGNLEYWTDSRGTPHWSESGKEIDLPAFTKKFDQHMKTISKS